MKKIHCINILSLLFLFVFSSFAWAQFSEFSADSVTKTQGMTMNGRAFFKGHKMRVEQETPAGTNITIMDLKKQKAWVLMPQEQMYMPLNYAETAAQHGSDEHYLEEIAVRKEVGQETINGFECIKYVYEYKDSSMGTMIQWFSKKLNFPIRTEYRGQAGQSLTEYTNIRMGGVADSLFTIPAGYSKLPGMESMPSMEDFDLGSMPLFGD